MEHFCGLQFFFKYLYSNIFRDDLESCTLSSSEDEEEEEEPIGQISTFEMLHAPRKPIVWSEQELSDFDMKSRLLDMRMDHWDLARIANVPKRIAKGETVNLRMPRYSLWTENCFEFYLICFQARKW